MSAYRPKGALHIRSSHKRYEPAFVCNLKWIQAQYLAGALGFFADRHSILSISICTPAHCRTMEEPVS